jgi:hypothetical protein
LKISYHNNYTFHSSLTPSVFRPGCRPYRDTVKDRARRIYKMPGCGKSAHRASNGAGQGARPREALGWRGWYMRGENGERHSSLCSVNAIGSSRAIPSACENGHWETGKAGPNGAGSGNIYPPARARVQETFGCEEILRGACAVGTYRAGTITDDTAVMINKTLRLRSVLIVAAVFYFGQPRPLRRETKPRRLRAQSL